MIGAEECQILLEDEFDLLSKKGVPPEFAKKIIENKRW
jgi:hypothetical protein